MHTQKHTEETKQKLSLLFMGKHNSPSTEFKKGQTPWIKGRKHSKESLKKMSDIKKGKHLSPSTEFKKGNISLKKGIPLSLETRRKLSVALKGLFVGNKNPFYGNHHSQASVHRNSEVHKGKIPWNKGLKGIFTGDKNPFYGKHHTEAVKQKNKEVHIGKQIGENNPFYGKKHTELTKQKMREAHKNRPHFISKETRDIMREKGKRNWLDKEYVKRVMAKYKPNKPETFLINLLNGLMPNEYKYVGNGEVIIAGKNPDFVNVNGQKKIIELFGDYWHRGQNPEDRINTFKPYGWDTLVIWERELKNIPALKEKLLQFNSKETL